MTAPVSQVLSEAERDIASVIRWFDNIQAVDWEDIVADGGVTAAMVIQQEARTVQAPRLRRVLAALAKEQGR